MLYCAVFIARSFMRKQHWNFPLQPTLDPHQRLRQFISLSIASFQLNPHLRSMRPLTVRNLAHAISTAHVYKIPWKYQAFHTLTSSDINKNKNSPKATMTRVLLTGGSGFIAAHVLDILLQHGHSVVTTPAMARTSLTLPLSKTSRRKMLSTRLLSQTRHSRLLFTLPGKMRR
jgi:hypothetical protein